jgi:hypothetical protein
MATHGRRYNGGGLNIVYFILYTIFSLSGGMVTGIGLFIAMEDRFGAELSIAICSIAGVSAWGALVIAYLKD